MKTGKKNLSSLFGTRWAIRREAAETFASTGDWWGEFKDDGEVDQKNNVTRDELNRVLQSTFKPEFLNRLDEIVIFHGLTKNDLNRIVDIQLKRVKELLAQRDIKIELTQAAKDYIVDKGSDTDFGARPLKRAIQHELQDPLALEILEGNFVEGDTVKVDSDGEKLRFSK